MGRPEVIHVYVSAHGNLFMREIAELLGAALIDAGYVVDLRLEGLPAAERGLLNLVVAPHEYFPLLEQVDERDRLAAAAASVPVGTEQPGTPWFELGLHYARRSPVLLDINSLAVEALRARGLNAHHFPLGYHSSLDHGSGDLNGDRPIDVVFMGGWTQRREELLSKHAAFFASLECRFMIADPTRPIREQDASFASGSEKYELLRRTKVLLNIHRGESEYFEWHRALPALANGCVILTEPATGHEPLRNFEHYVEAPHDRLGAWTMSLVLDDERRHRMARDAYQFVRSELDLSRFLETFIPSLNERATRPRPPAGRRHDSLRPTQRRLTPRRAGAAIRYRAETYASARLAQALQPLQAQGASSQQLMKRLLLGQRALMRRLDALEHSLSESAHTTHDAVTTSAYASALPNVSVVVPLYNYEHFIGECLESVAASVGVDPELIVVNDRSTDASEERVLRFLEAHDHLPAVLLSKHANQGLARARNTGIAHARSEFVFLLDADNMVYPHALRKLRDALASSNAAFAYGIIERFGERPGLISFYPWDPERLVLGNYIDAMSMLRRVAWEQVGGFNLDERLYGWEDYDFWLSLAAAGLEGKLVPQILTRYRSHPESMIATTNLETDSLFRYLRARHKRLPWPQEAPL